MKKIVQLTLACLFLSIFIFNKSTAQIPRLEITSPNSGSYETQDTVSIAYTGGDTSKSIYISLINKLPFRHNFTIANIPYGDGTFKWLVDPRIDSGTYQIYVENNRHGLVGTHDWRYSGLITINAVPTIVLTSPNGGETFRDGQPIIVTWKTYHYWSPTVNIIMAYSQGNFLNGAVSISNGGTINDGIDTVNLDRSVTAQYGYGDHYKIFVTNGGGPTLGPSSGFSDSTFTICRPSITLVEPNGGTTYQAGQPISITWNTDCYDIAPNVAFDLVDGSTHSNTFLFSATGLPNTGIYNDIMPANIPTGNYKIRIITYDPSFTGGYDPYYRVDISDTPFTINN